MTASSPVMSAGPDVATEQATDTAAQQVTARLRQTRQRVLRIRWLTAAGSLVVLGLAVIAGLALVDSAFELSFGLRALTFAGLLALLASCLWGIRRRSIADVTLAKTAAATESQIAQFGQRLRTTLDYEQRPQAQAAASPRLLAALRRQTAQLAGQVDWEAAVDDRPALLALGAAGVALLGWGGALALVPEYRTATARVLLLPAEYTQVVYTPQEQTVRFGETAELEVTISGRPIAAAEVRHRPAGSQDDWTTIDLARLHETPTAERDETVPPPAAASLPAALTGTFRPRLEALEHDLEFEVLAGPRALPLGRITVVQPLTLERTSAHILPPPYTGRPAETVAALDLRVLEGSTVELRFELNRQAAEAELIPLRDSAKQSAENAAAAVPPTVPLTISGTTLVGSLPDLRESGSYRLAARTADGMSLDSTTLRIRVQADRPPEVRFVAPQEELVVTATTEVPVIAEASDDLGLHAVGLQYQVNDGELRTLWEGSGEGSTETLRAIATLLLEELNVTFRDSVSYYAYAEDHYFGQPRRTTTELRFMDIRPYKVDYQLTEGGGEGSGTCNGSSASLEELIQRQRKILVATFAAREDRPASAEIAESLRQQEADLRRTTGEFAEELAAKIGPVPPLAKAAEGMDTAVDSLAERELPGAVAGERQALAALMQARENLRQMLKNSNSQQASACRQVDRKFQQKLRLPEKKSETPESRLADARNQLQKLAELERQWGQQARQSCQSPGSSSSSGSSSKSAPSQSASQKPNSNPAATGQSPASATPQGEQPSGETPPGESPSSPGQPSPPGGASKPGDEPKPGGSPSEATPSAEELAAAQAKLRQELAELKRQLSELKAAGATAPQQADHADEAMQRGLEQLAQQQGDGAAQAADDSAKQLEQLADHLAALGTQDFGQRLDEAHRQAQALAQAQAEVARDAGAPESAKSESAANGRPGAETNSQSAAAAGGSPSAQSGSASASTAGSTAAGAKRATGAQAGESPQQPRRPDAELARAQQQLATRMEMLAEVLDALRRNASTESPALRRQLDTAAAETPPAQIADAMRQAARQLASGPSPQAAQGAAEARDDLRQLAQALGGARGAFAQPQLQELLSLEEQLAQLLQQVARGDEARAAEFQRKWQDLAAKLDRLSAGDRRLAEALDKSPTVGKDGSPSQSPNGSSTGSETPTQAAGTNPPAPGANPRPGKQVPNGSRIVTPGHYEWITQRNIDGIRDMARVLQTRIQEAILAGALLDSDQPIPPEYKPLVEKYYKTLSDDLR